MYWQPGGNTDLKPEESLNEEAGLIIRLNNNLFKNTEISGTVFHSQIENCIQWVPTAYTYWAPQNLKTVRTQGIECMGHTSIEIGKLAMTFNSGYSFTSASNIKSLTPNDESLNKQLIYLPYDKGFINVSILFKDFMVAYNHQFTGFRFVNINNTDFLPAYDLGSCSANYTMPIGKASLQAMFAVDNLWDRSYQVIAWRPMPGRAFRTGISIKFNNN